MYDMTLELFGYLTVQACTRMQLKFNESWHGRQKLHNNLKTCNRFLHEDQILLTLALCQTDHKKTMLVIQSIDSPT